MTSPIPPSSSPIPPPISPAPPVIAPAVESIEGALPPTVATIGTHSAPPADFTGEVLFAMMRSVETSTAAGRPHETLQVLSTLPAPLRQSDEASYFGGMALLQQGRPEDAAALAQAALQRTPDSVPLLLLAAAAEPPAPPMSAGERPAVVPLPAAIIAQPVSPAITPPTAPIVAPPATPQPATLPTVAIPATTPATVIPPQVILPGTVQPPTVPTVPLLNVLVPDIPETAPPMAPAVTPPAVAPTTTIPAAMQPAPAPGAPIAPPSSAPAEASRPAVNVAPLLAMGIPAPSSDAPALAAPVALPMTPVIAMPATRAALLLLRALDLAPRDISIFARIASLLVGTRERPLVSALFRELEAAAPSSAAVRKLTTLLSGAAPPEWNPWARQVAARELWPGEGIVDRTPISTTPARLARLVTEHLAQGEPARALVLLELPNAPSHPQLALLRAEALLQLQRPEAALAVIHEALERFPEAERPLRVAEERLQRVLELPLGSRDARLSVPLLRALAVHLGLVTAEEAATTAPSLADAALPILDAATAQQSEVVMEARVRLLIASGRGDLALLELRQARDLRPEVTAFGRMFREVDQGLDNALPIRTHQEAAAILAPLRERHAELPTLLSLAVLERLVHSGEMSALRDTPPQPSVSGVVDFRGPEGTAAAQWMAQFAVPPTAGTPGGAFLIVALSVGFVLFVAGRRGMVMLWTILCLLLAAVWRRMKRGGRRGDV